MADSLMASIWAYYMPIGLLAFLLAIAIMLAMAAVTVGGKVVKAAMANPANTLRDE